MFGKLKKVLAQIETIWAYIDDHKDDIAQLQKELAATQKTLKALTATKATVKKTTKQLKVIRPPAYNGRGPYLFGQWFWFVCVCFTCQLLE